MVTQTVGVGSTAVAYVASWNPDTGILKYYQLGFSWNEIGDKNNLSATFDFIHLNERSGILLEHLVQQSMKTINDLNF